jgi:hypothetical protein
MVIERQDVWYMDEGGLTYNLCEDNSPLAEPPVIRLFKLSYFLNFWDV